MVDNSPSILNSLYDYLGRTELGVLADRCIVNVSFSLYLNTIIQRDLWFSVTFLRLHVSANQLYIKLVCKLYHDRCLWKFSDAVHKVNTKDTYRHTLSPLGQVGRIPSQPCRFLPPAIYRSSSRTLLRSHEFYVRTNNVAHIKFYDGFNRSTSAIEIGEHRDSPRNLSIFPPHTICGETEKWPWKSS